MYQFEEVELTCAIIVFSSGTAGHGGCDAVHCMVLIVTVLKRLF